MKIARQVLSAAAAVTLLSSVALAQVHQVQLGGGMDANPGVGTGGANRPVPGFVPINGNDIMTGNVSGLAYFHGRVGTSSPYQFQGNLGSGSLSSFARQSAGVPYNRPYIGVTQTYYLPSNTVSTAQGALYSAPVGSGFDSALIPRSSISPVASSAQISAFNGGISGGQAINRALPVAQLQPGSPGAVLSSPLFVLRTTELPVRKPDIGLVTGMPVSGQPLPVGLNAGSGPTTVPANPDLIQGQVNGGSDARVTSQDEQLKGALVSENYLKLADELNRAKGAAGSDNTNNADVSLTNNLSPNRTGMDIDPLTGKPRLIATLPSFTGRNGSGGTTGTGATTQSAMTNKGPSLSAQRLTELSDAELMAGSKVQPVHLAAPKSNGGQASGFELMMARAETNLKGARFLDAAESYQAALALKPDDPLALVGRAHAEMGAGIYAAAEYDLKFVYTRKPEMVALRYDVNSFIPSSRQQFLLEDFQKMTAKKETANMASFLYCYLCYETGRTTDLQAELKSWGARPDHDEWQAVAQRAWLPSKP